MVNSCPKEKLAGLHYLVFFRLFAGVRTMTAPTHVAKHQLDAAAFPLLHLPAQVDNQGFDVCKYQGSCGRRPKNQFERLSMSVFMAPDDIRGR